MPRLILLYLVSFVTFLAPRNAISVSNSSTLAEQPIIQNNNYSQTTYGGIGLIQTPTARFSDDGEFLFGISSEEPWNRLFGRIQFFPWMEATLRYTEGKYKPYNPGSKQTWKDKGIDLKFKISNETEKLPALAIGINDFGGTGAYSSEYLVLSKNFGDFDLTTGIGWGRLGGVDHGIKNIFSWIDDSRKSRSVDYYRKGGKFNLNRMFAGQNSIFGGFEYQMPIPNLTLKIEYDSSDYSKVIGREKIFDQTGDIFELDSRINFGLNYHLAMSERDILDLSLGFVRGNTIYANFAVHSNLNNSGSPKIVMGSEKLKVSPIKSFLSLDESWQDYLTDTIIWELGNVGFVTHKLIFNDKELIAEISQGRMKNTQQAVDLASRVVANNAPKNIENITIVNIDQGIETLRATVNKNDLMNDVYLGPLREDSITYNKFFESTSKPIIRENKFLYPNFFWELKPHMLGTLQHQAQFYFWQLEALLHTEYSFKKGLYLTTDIGINVANNYDRYTYHIPDGELYHVRQNRRLYLTEGESGLRKMALDYMFQLRPNITGKLSAGYLEPMFGGFGGELMYMPNNKRWALSIDSYWVKQRDYDQKFSFKDYDTFTGFITYHRDIPFYDMRFKLSVGKFLAKDKGAHIDLSRRFKTGARVGGIIALTDCDSVCVGEGSFNKWIYFELPMELFYTRSPTRGRAGYSWSPLTKDAGQKLDTGNLYNVMINATEEVESLRLKSWSLRKILGGFSLQPNKER